MASLFAQVLPLALGMAVSPAVLTLVVLILSGRHHPVPRAWAFVVGLLLVVLVLMAVGLLFLGRLPDHASGHESAAQDWGKVAAGTALLLLGLRELRPARTPGERQRAASAARAKRMANAGLGVFVGIGALTMLFNFSSIVLFIPALHMVSVSSADTAAKALVCAFLVLMMLLPGLVPVLLVTVMGRRADPRLARLNAFTTAHQRQINAGICFVFAAVLLWGGIKGLV